MPESVTNLMMTITEHDEEERGMERKLEKRKVGTYSTEQCTRCLGSGSG